MRLHLGAVRTPWESLPWKATPRDKSLARLGTRTCISIASGFSVGCSTNCAIPAPYLPNDQPWGYHPLHTQHTHTLGISLTSLPASCASLYSRLGSECCLLSGQPTHVCAIKNSSRSQATAWPRQLALFTLSNMDKSAATGFNGAIFLSCQYYHLY